MNSRDEANQAKQQSNHESSHSNQPFSQQSSQQSSQQQSRRNSQSFTIPVDRQSPNQIISSTNHSNDYAIRIDRDQSPVAIDVNFQNERSVNQSHTLSVDESANQTFSSDDEDSTLIDSVQQSIEEDFIAKTEMGMLARLNEHRQCLSESFDHKPDLLSQNADIFDMASRALHVSNHVASDSSSISVSAHSNEHSVVNANNQSILIDAVELGLIDQSGNRPVSPRSVSRRSSLSIGSNYRNNRSIHHSVDLTNNPSLNQLAAISTRRYSRSHPNNQSISQIDDQDAEEQHRWLTHANFFLETEPNLLDQSAHRSRRQSADLSNYQSTQYFTNQQHQVTDNHYDHSHNQPTTQSDTQSNFHSYNRDDQLYDQSHFNSHNQSTNQSVTRLRNPSVHNSHNQSDFYSNNHSYPQSFQATNQLVSNPPNIVDDEKKQPQPYQSLVVNQPVNQSGLPNNQFVDRISANRSFTPVIKPTVDPAIIQASKPAFLEHRLTRSVSHPITLPNNEPNYLSINPNYSDSLLLPEIASALQESRLTNHSPNQSSVRRGHSRSRSFRYSPSMSAQNLVNQSVNEPHQFFNQLSDQQLDQDDEKDFLPINYQSSKKQSFDQSSGLVAKKIEFNTPSKLDEHEPALPVDQSLNHSFIQPVNQSRKQSTHQLNHQYLHPQAAYLIDESKSQNHSSKAFVDQSISQSISQSSWLSPIYQSKIVGFPRAFLQSILTCLLCSPPTPALTNIQSNNLLITSKHCLIDCTLLSSINQSISQSFNQSGLPYDIANAIRALFPFSVSTLVCTPETVPSDLYQSAIPSIAQSNNQFNQSANNSSISQFNGPIFSEICILHRVDQLSPITQSIINQAIRVKQISVNGRIINLPKTHLIIATHSHIHSNNQSINQSMNLSQPHHVLKQSINQSNSRSNNQSMNQSISRSLLDCFLFDLVVEPGFVNELRSFAHSHSASIKQSINQPTHPLSSHFSPSIHPSNNHQPINQSINHLHIWPLLDSLTQVCLVPGLRSYIDDIIVCVRHHCRVMLGPNQSVNQSISVAACVNALIDGRSFVRPDDIDAVVENVMAHRISLRPINQFMYQSINQSVNQSINQSNGFSYTARAIVKHLVKNVLRPPK